MTLSYLKLIICSTVLLYIANLHLLGFFEMVSTFDFATYISMLYLVAAVPVSSFWHTMRNESRCVHSQRGAQKKKSVLKKSKNVDQPINRSNNPLGY